LVFDYEKSEKTKGGIVKIVKLIFSLFFMIFLFKIVQGQTFDPSLYKINKYGYTSSSICGKCHEGLYKYWFNSMHAKSYEDPVFQIAYLKAQSKEGEKIREYCLSCHSPTIRLTKDYNMKRKISKEGVTCDFCHTIKDVDFTKEDPFIYDLGITKYGPYRDVKSPVHKTSYSKIHRESKFCAGCHEQSSKKASHIKVLGTYSEWKESPYSAKDIHCQNCHMPNVIDIPIVKPEIKKSDKLATAHEFMGGHSEIRLEKAASLTSHIERNGSKVKVTVYITNKESGHKLPTGTPARKVILIVNLKDKEGKLLAEKKKIYQKVLVDEKGKVLDDITDMLLKSVAVLSDNRISPKETRKEEFQFDIPKKVRSIIVESILRYEFETPVVMTRSMIVEMARDIKSSTIKGWSLFVGFLGWIIGVAIIFILGALVMYLIYRFFR
jgi:hypothetical protein